MAELDSLGPGEMLYVVNPRYHLTKDQMGTHFLSVCFKNISYKYDYWKLASGLEQGIEDEVNHVLNM